MFLFSTKIFRPAKLANLNFQFNPEKNLNLLVLHGLMGSKTNFRSVIKAHEISSHLKEGHLVDLRNHGESEHIMSMNYEELALDIKHYINSKQLTNVVLLGHSFGGRNIFSYLQNFPSHAEQHVKGVIIADIKPTPFQSGFVKQLLQRLNEIKLTNRFYKDVKKDIDQATEESKEIAGLLLTNLVSKNLDIDYTHQQDFFFRVNLESLINSFDYMSGYNFKCNWKGPATVICGEQSQYVNQNDRPLFTQVFPYIDIEKHIHFIPNCGHWVHAQKPREFIKLCGNFLSKLY